jgi:hypothetical protein
VADGRDPGTTTPTDDDLKKKINKNLERKKKMKLIARP